MCQPVTLEQIFPLGEGSDQLAAWKFDLTGDVAATYYWNVTAETFLVPGVAVPQNEAATQQSSNVYNAIQFDIPNAIASQDYEAALSRMNELIAGISSTDQINPLNLEALNRSDEALAEYVAIYEAAPKSAWGMLAALHLERVE